MKVTVCFGTVRVVVPCGSGQLLVQDLIDKAIIRYKKAICKPPDYWVIIHNLKSSSDGGILDPDDQLNDVADDREQIVAQYEEQDAPPVPHNGGDGTSASSAGTASPDMFSGPDLLTQDKAYARRHGGKNDVIITENDLNTGSTLIVRRGSEPALTTVGTEHHNQDDLDEKPTPSNLKRWSAIASIDETKSSRDSDESNTEDDIPVPVRTGGIGQEQWSAFSRFARDSTRQSLASNSSTLQRWIDTQDKHEEKYNNYQMHVSRKEPVGGSGKDDAREAEENKRNELQDRLQSPERPEGTVISLKNTGGPLGIHVVPDYDDSGRAQDVFKQALQTNEISLRVHKSNTDVCNSSTSSSPSTGQPQSQPKPFSKVGEAKKKPALTIAISPTKSESDASHSQPRAEERKVAQVTPTISEDDWRPVTPGRRVPPAVPVRNPNTALSSPTKTKFVAPTNTRRIGKKIDIELTKGSDGLGFSVTTRDNPAGGNCPIYIKNILPKGAAVRDGNLKSGDRLLEVNGVAMTGKSQTEAVSILRNTKTGSVVSLVVSRQVLESETPTETPNPGLSSGLSGEGVSSQKAEPESVAEPTPPGMERLTYNIPLNECGSAGLGVSVKGKTATLDNGSHDLGIFIKSVIAGGAASKDGRLKLNDQLLEVNHEVLTGLSNSEAMEQLRTAMQKDQPLAGSIHLVVGRRPSSTSSRLIGAEGREVRISHSEDPQESLPSNLEKTDGPQPESYNLNNGPSLVPLPGGHQQERPVTIGVSKVRNPVLDRLTGLNSPEVNNIRNESYQRATHDSLNESIDSMGSDKTTPLPNNNGMTISSPNSHRPETVLIEGDNYQVQMRQGSVPKVRPASTLGFTRAGGPDMPLSLPLSHSDDELEDSGAPRPPSWLLAWDKDPHAHQSPTAATEDMSPTGEDGDVFSREGFGRRSMSEKRRGHLDPRISEFYQKLKQGKGGNMDAHYSATWDRKKTRQKAKLEEEQGKLGVTGPMLGLKKSSSLESLQTAVAEVLDDGAPSWRPTAPGRSMVRGRGCNDSFRAAVDHSYDNSGATQGEAMETLEEEESNDSGSVAHGHSHSMAESVQSYSGSDIITGYAEDGRKTKSKKAKKEPKDKEKDKDKGGLFKGLGHMFRFGRHRKQLDQGGIDRTSRDPDTSRESDTGRHRHEEVERTRARQAAQEEHDRIHEQFRRLQEKQHEIEAAKRLQDDQLRNAHHVTLGSLNSGSVHDAAPSGGASGLLPNSSSSLSSSPLNRAERIQQLRAEHQRRHRERHGQYPLDAQEEAYEHEIQEKEKQRRFAEGVYRDNYPVPPRRPSEPATHQLEPYERPQSRLGYAPDPTRYSHYQNFHEIHAQLNTHDRYQQMYQHYMAHQMAAAAAAGNEQRQRAKTPEPTRSAPLTDPYEVIRGYPRSQSTADARLWHTPSHGQHVQHIQQGQHMKHVQQLPAHMQHGQHVGHHAQHVQVVRPHPQMPQLPYVQRSAGKAPVAMLPPQILVNAPHEHYHHRGDLGHYADPMSFTSDPGYGSLHRRRDDRGQNGVVSGPAQV